MSKHPDFVEPANPEQYGVAASATAGQEGERLLREFIHATVATQSGERFLDAMVRVLWAELGAILVFVGETDADLKNVKTRVVFREGVRANNFSYALEGTPCETVVGPLQVCMWTNHVAEQFPHDEGLREMGAQGYTGMPLFDRVGRRIGVLVAVTNRPIDSPDSTAVLMRFFARRTALELEQLIAVDKASENLRDIEVAIAQENIALGGALQETGVPGESEA